jgi:hypothetical protein
MATYVRSKQTTKISKSAAMQRWPFCDRVHPAPYRVLQRKVGAYCLSDVTVRAGQLYRGQQHHPRTNATDRVAK